MPYQVDDCPYLDKLQDHDWTECPFAHPGEKAKRRDPRKHLYASAACPDFRKVSRSSSEQLQSSG